MDILLKDELLNFLARRTGYSKKSCEEVMNALADVIYMQVSQVSEVRIPNIGRLYFEVIPEREGRKPTPGKVGMIEKVVYPPSYRLRFTLSKKLRRIAKAYKPKIVGNQTDYSNLESEGEK